MRKRLWYDLTQTRHSVEYSTLYIERGKKYLKYYNILILTCSTSGVAGWKFWEDYPLYVCLAICLASFFKLLQSHLIVDEKQLIKWYEVNSLYGKYYNKLEKLWYDFENDKLTEDDLSDRFFQLKKTDDRISQIVNELGVRKPKKLVLKAKEYSDEYFVRVFNTKS